DYYCGSWDSSVNHVF
nr:immunoglobulin light chain junction region [Macaca mulatta]MOW57132.1 immunoglobulin light chain junction region [Macaca mulatta]MOW58232.1 immunoglobulin light chain junction region [Macaca mulatta]MOW59942.1 immunoglobulin light chain junction region [Macaca mulatta]